jgi:hypothetical protein
MYLMQSEIEDIEKNMGYPGGVLTAAATIRLFLIDAEDEGYEDIPIAAIEEVLDNILEAAAKQDNHNGGFTHKEIIAMEEDLIDRANNRCDKDEQ